MKQTISQKYGVYIPTLCVIIFSIKGLLVPHAEHWSSILLVNALVYGLGLQITIAGFLHIFNGDNIAEYIGWGKGSPFQYEVGVAGIAFGALGFLSAWMPPVFWIAPVVAITIFGWGAGIGHIMEIHKKKNKNPGNIGFFFYWDFIMPAYLITLLTIHYIH